MQQAMEGVSHNSIVLVASGLTVAQGVEDTKTALHYSEASELALMLAVETEWRLRVWGLWGVVGLLLLVGIVFLICSKV